MKYKKVYAGPGYPVLSEAVVPWVTRGLTPDKGVDVAVPRALREIEGGKLGATEISRHFGFSVDEIKKTWGI